MEAALNYIQSTKSKKFKDMNDGKNKNNDDDDFYDAWGLLKQVELKDKFIKNLNEKLQETETKLKALNQKFKIRGKEFDEYMMNHKTDLYNQLKQNRSSQLDSMRSEKRLADEEKQLETMTKEAYEKIASMESKDSIEDLEGVFVEFPNGSDEGMKTLLEIKPTEKLKSLIDFLLKGNEQKVQLQKSLTDLKNERAKILELMSKKLGITFDQKDLHNVDFEELFENFARDVDKETEEKNEMKENLNLIREKLSKALEDNRVIKEKAMKLEDNLKMKETERNLRNQSAKEGNSTPVNNKSASKNKKVRFCNLKTTQIYPFMEKDFELVSANKPAANNFN
ncbi:hypothetical protein HELRODRAFT_184714 [Helobdella robusta]|uniref:Uncharacterized protein n=1 Tax=Helobdella robusta TaxID=6412 RepID=T1FLU4_HELRO|nr:hypothetical protein HELRODRAFT_184714 [Helobdella robusta]ESO04131.1 hypothetical protein HELRODRAFT_184714 [Helobdella robusta]